MVQVSLIDIGRTVNDCKRKRYSYSFCNTSIASKPCSSIGKICILIADHVPRMVGDSRTGWAFSLGYIRALYDMACDERASKVDLSKQSA